MTEPSRRQNLHSVKDNQRDAAIILLEDLIRRAKANEITILAVTEYESGPGPKKHLEISYVGKGAPKTAEV